MSLPKVLLLTDRSQLPDGRSLAEQVGRAVGAGVSHVILRELDLPDADRDALAGEMSSVGAAVIAAHRPAPHAIGLHEPSAGIYQTFVRSADLPNVRKVGEGPVGRSCHSRDEVAAAAAEGCTYATLGPFATTASKPGYGPPVDRAAYGDLPIPTYALGGITPSNARDAIGAGAYGVAVMGAVMRAEHPETVVAQILEAIAVEKIA